MLKWVAMQKLPDSLKQPFTQRWLSTLPFVVALVVLAIMGWTIIKLVGYPDDGIVYMHPTGQIEEIDPTGPAAGTLQRGDMVVSIDGKPWENFSGYDEKREGDPVEFVIIRDGIQHKAAYYLSSRSLPDNFQSLAPIFIAMLFWGIGLGVQTFKPSEGATDLFFAWCQASALTLTAGTASSLGPVWTSKLFGSMLWLLGPLSVHFHMRFPQVTLYRGRRTILAFLYAIAAVGMSPYLLLAPDKHRAMPWYPLHISAGRRRKFDPGDGFALYQLPLRGAARRARQDPIGCLGRCISGHTIHLVNRAARRAIGTPNPIL